jgi:glutathione S-transferase
MTLVLYAHPLSSFSQKALIALDELGLDFEFRQVGGPADAATAQLREMWPYGKIPLLTDGDLVLPESTLIAEHLDTLAGGARLLPANPAQRMEARLIDRVIDSYVAAPQMKLMKDQFRPPEQSDQLGLDESRAMLQRSYAWLDARLAGRQWAVGDPFTLADCAAAPMLFYADWFQPIPEGHFTVRNYLARLRQRPSVARIIEAARPYWPMVPGGIPPHVQ